MKPPAWLVELSEEFAEGTAWFCVSLGVVLAAAGLFQ